MAIVAGCGDDAAPASRALATTSQPHDIALEGDQLYWSANGRIDRVPITGGPRLSLVAPRATRFVVASDALYWHSHSTGFDYSHLMVTDASGTRELTLDGYWHILPVCLDEHGALLMTATSDTDGSAALVRRNREGWISEPGRFDGEVWGVLCLGPSSNPTLFVEYLTYDADGSAAIAPYGRFVDLSVGGIRRPGGLAFGDGTLFWSDRNYPGRPAELYARRDRSAPPVLITEIGEDDVGPWWGGGRLWMIERGDAEATLVAIDPRSGARERHVLDHVPGSVTMSDAGFATWADGQLRWQPLP